jgi:hypothetical protein
MTPITSSRWVLFTQDLCALLNGEPTCYLPVQNISRNMGFELIEATLQNHQKTFESNVQLIDLLKEGICTLIIKNFIDKLDYSETLRLWRIVSVIVMQYSNLLKMECEIFFTLLIKALSKETYPWQKVLSLEIFRSITKKFSFLPTIFTLFDKDEQSSNVFSEMVDQIFRLYVLRPINFSNSEDYSVRFT